MAGEIVSLGGGAVTITQAEAQQIALKGAAGANEITLDSGIRIFGSVGDIATIQLQNTDPNHTGGNDVYVYAPGLLQIFADAGNDYASGAFSVGFQMGITAGDGYFGLTASSVQINGTNTVSGSFTSQDGKTVTVTHGLITGIV